MHSAAEDDREDSYEHHWAPTPKIFGGRTGQELSQLNWTKSSATLPALGKVTEAKPEGVQITSQDKASIVSRVGCLRGPRKSECMLIRGWRFAVQQDPNGQAQGQDGN